MFKVLVVLAALIAYVHADAPSETCVQAAQILGGELSSHDNVCEVFVPRNDVVVTLAGFTLS